MAAKATTASTLAKATTLCGVKLKSPDSEARTPPKFRPRERTRLALDVDSSCATAALMRERKATAHRLLNLSERAPRLLYLRAPLVVGLDADRPAARADRRRRDELLLARARTASAADGVERRVRSDPQKPGAHVLLVLQRADVRVEFEKDLLSNVLGQP